MKTFVQYLSCNIPNNITNTQLGSNSEYTVSEWDEVETARRRLLAIETRENKI